MGAPVIMGVLVEHVRDLPASPGVRTAAARGIVSVRLDEVRAAGVEEGRRLGWDPDVHGLEEPSAAQLQTVAELVIAATAALVGVTEELQRTAS